MMKTPTKIFLLMAILLFSVYPPTARAQQVVEPGQTKEYATVFLKVYYQSNTIAYDKNGSSKSPVVSIPNGQQAILYDTKKMFSDKVEGELRDVNLVINYMASFGWILNSSNILPYDGDRTKPSGIGALDTSQFLQLLIFERPFSKK